MPNTNRGGAEDPTIKTFSIKLVTDHFEYALKRENRPRPTAVSQINRR